MLNFYSLFIMKQVIMCDTYTVTVDFLYLRLHNGFLNAVTVALGNEQCQLFRK